MLKGRRWAAFFMTIAAAACGVFGGPIVGGWTINTDASGGATSLTLSNPRTYLNIEQTIDIVVDYQGAPLRGTVKFRNGVQKEPQCPAGSPVFLGRIQGCACHMGIFRFHEQGGAFQP